MSSSTTKAPEELTSSYKARLLLSLPILAFVALLVIGVTAVARSGEASANAESVMPHPAPGSATQPAKGPSVKNSSFTTPTSIPEPSAAAAAERGGVYRTKLVQFDVGVLPAAWQVIGEYRINQGGINSPADYTSEIQLRTDSGGLIRVIMVQDEIPMDKPDLMFSSSFEPFVLSDGAPAWSIDDPEYGFAALGVVIDSQTHMLFISEGGLGLSVLEDAYELIQPAENMTFCPSAPEAPECRKGSSVEGSPEL